MAKILIVDDSQFMRKLLGGILENAGHVIVGEACDGNEVMEKYAKLRPNLVFMDITMKYVSGIEGLKRIKILDSNAKVIMCSAMGQQLMVEECITEGAVDFIVKPFNKNKIIQAVDNALLKM